MLLTEKEIHQFIQKYFYEQYLHQQALFSNGLNILIANNNPLNIQERGISYYIFFHWRCYFISSCLFL